MVTHLCDADVPKLAQVLRFCGTSVESIMVICLAKVGTPGVLYLDLADPIRTEDDWAAWGVASCAKATNDMMTASPFLYRDACQEFWVA